MSYRRWPVRVRIPGVAATKIHCGDPPQKVLTGREQKTSKMIAEPCLYQQFKVWSGLGPLSGLTTQQFNWLIK